MKCEAIEKRESERREVDGKKHKEEVQYLENYGKLSFASCSSVSEPGRIWSFAFEWLGSTTSHMYNSRWIQIPSEGALHTTIQQFRLLIVGYHGHPSA